MENLSSVIVVVIEPFCYSCAVVEWGDEDVMVLEEFEVMGEGREECADYSTRLSWRASREFANIY
jgi:hypothetical protein